MITQELHIRESTYPPIGRGGVKDRSRYWVIPHLYAGEKKQADTIPWSYVCECYYCAIFNTEIKTGYEIRANPEIVAYTFRHCTIADWCSAGLPIADVAELCGTSIEMIDKHYHKFIRSNFEEQLAGLQTI